MQRYTDTLAAMLPDRDCGAVLFMHAPTAIVRSDDIARACAPLLPDARREAPREAAFPAKQVQVAVGRDTPNDSLAQDYCSMWTTRAVPR